MAARTANLAFLMIGILFSDYGLAKESEDSLREKDCFSGSYEAYIDYRSSLAPEDKQRNVADSVRSKILKGEYQDLQANFTCKIFVYQSDEYPVGAMLIKPETKQGEKLPTVIFNRGGNGRFGALTSEAIFQQLKPIADLGIVVLATQYRGGMELTDGPGGDVDEFGGRDVQDVVNIVKLATGLPYVDQDDMHMVGVSRGGMSSFLALLDVDNIKSITVVGSPSDLFKSLEERPEMENVFNLRVPDLADNRDNELKKRSVVSWAEDIPRTIPILILHGSRDKKVSVEQAKLLANKLSAIGHPHKLVIYDDFHGLQFSQGLMQSEIEAWIKGSD